MFADPVVEKLAAFVRSVGIGVERATLDRPTRFPGLDIANGAVLIDEERLIHPGNILHEAGHLAVHDPAKRKDPQIDPSGGEELSTLAWSYAAALYLGFDPALVFYPGSFQGEDRALIENFAEGRFMGVPLLQRFGMSVEPTNAAARGVEPFPHMLRWVR
jgi:hypothetical protein